MRSASLNSVKPCLKGCHASVSRTFVQKLHKQVLTSRRCCVVRASDDKQFDPQPDIWESEVLGVVFKVSFVAVCVGAVVTMLKLATPVINTTVNAFPIAVTESSGGAIPEELLD